MVQDIKLYTAAICPWAQRATLALEVVGAPWERVEIDLQNKPEWYASKINPASKVPVIQVGSGDDAPKIPESAVIVELVADLFKDSHPILPEDPIKRAEIRYFVERFGQLIRPHLLGKDVSLKPQILQGIEEIQNLLQKNPGKFYLNDDFGYAEILIAPFIGRSYYFAEFGLQPAQDVYAIVESDPKYAVYKNYVKDIINTPYFKKTFDKDYVVGASKKRLGFA